MGPVCEVVVVAREWAGLVERMVGGASGINIVGVPSRRG